MAGELGSMPNLQVLILGSNLFSGMVPKELAKMKNLAHFMLTVHQ